MKNGSRSSRGYIEREKKKKMVFSPLTTRREMRGTSLVYYICSLKGLERAVDMDDTVSRMRLSSFFWLLLVTLMQFMRRGGRAIQASAHYSGNEAGPSDFVCRCWTWPNFSTFLFWFAQSPSSHFILFFFEEGGPSSINALGRL